LKENMKSKDYLGELFGLSGHTAVVIGGTGELCGAMAEGLAGAGAEVVLVGRSEEKAKARLERITGSGGRGTFVPAEVSDRSSLERVLTTVTDRCENISILVNGAGVNSPTPFLEISDEEIHHILQVNLVSVMTACQVFGAHFLAQKKPASMINLGSISGLNPLSKVFTYSVSKAAVHNLTRNLAREWGPDGIRVNTLVPGFFPAEQNRKVLTPDRVKSIMNHTPMDRFGDASELVGATLLLASPKAGAFITGTEMVVDGGFQSMFI